MRTFRAQILMKIKDRFRVMSMIAKPFQRNRIISNDKEAGIDVQ